MPGNQQHRDAQQQGGKFRDGQSSGPDQIRSGQQGGKDAKGAPRPDERIRQDVSEALRRDGAIDLSTITVSVANGAVKLAGRVKDEATRRRAEEYARYCTGVNQVQNDLMIDAAMSSMPDQSSQLHGSKELPEES